MSPEIVGQRCVSEREPELGLGVVTEVDADARRIAIAFPATGESRLYALGTPVLKRVVFRLGDTITVRDGTTLIIESVSEEAGILVYTGSGERVREDTLSDTAGVTEPLERLLAGQVDPGEIFDLRRRTLETQARYRQSDVRGFLGGRVELIPHQFYILHEVASRLQPRVLLADEVGLGKTIEACLILQRLLAVGQARRALILVPESLVHQWFVELLRRFNLWFSIYDEERCLACEQSDAGQNPFLASQLVLASLGLFAAKEHRGDQMVAAGWDIVIIDEAHHLEWTPTRASPEYLLVEQLAGRSPGLLLLTATPTQLGMEGHFARLRLLDPDRHDDYDRFLAEADGFIAVAGVADKIHEGQPLAQADGTALKKIFHRDPERLEQLLDALTHEEPGARDALLRNLLDQHGTGRVMFRNTRAAMSGFPPRRYRPAAVETAAQGGLLEQIAREIRTEETNGEAGLRYTMKNDPRINWLAALLHRNRQAKILLICRSSGKVEAIAAALQDRINVKAGLFHEGVPLVQRDRNAAWFAEPDGAQLLLCSEIGSEGRNFQFAHHLVLFDLPLNPGLLEQRIGRLDRIGQTGPIRIHVPLVEASAAGTVAAWYHRGLDAFETPLHGGSLYAETFRKRLLGVALDGDSHLAEALIEETKEYHRKLQRRMKRGRDRLLELNSFNQHTATEVVARIREVDTDPRLRNTLADLFDHFGVRMTEHEAGDVFLDPSHAYLEGFPSLPADGMLATFDRHRALAREDIRFITPDHPLVQDVFDLLIESPAGTTAFGFATSQTPDLQLEAIFLLEPVADAHWHVEQFLAPTPVRVLVDRRGRDRSDEYDAAEIGRTVKDGAIQRFLERPGFDAAVLKSLLETARNHAETRSGELKEEAGTRADAALTADLQRLTDLRRLNEHVRRCEIDHARERLAHTREAIEQARLRLDAVRLIVAGPAPPG